MSGKTNFAGASSPQLKIYDDPYLKVRIDVRDISNIIHQRLREWTRSVAFSEKDDQSRQWVGNNVGAGSAGDLTKSVNFPTSGYYLINIFTQFNPQLNATFTLFDGTAQIEDTVYFYDKYNHYSYVQFKPRYFTAGNHNLKISYVPSGGWLSDILIIPIIRYEGDSLGNQYTTDHGLNVATCEFTKNSVSEMNTCTLSTEMQENYWNSDSKIDKPVVFDFLDHLTLWLGEDYNNTQIMFGGYSWPSAISTDEKLEIKAIDRMYDLTRTPTTATYGITPNGGFPTVYELARYLAAAPVFSVNTYSIPFDYAFYNDFSSTDLFNSITMGGNWSKGAGVETVIGSPAPSLKITSTSTAASSLQFWLNTVNPYDAVVYPYLNIGYYYTSGTQPPFPWNVHVKMFRDGETIANVVEYKLPFTQPTDPGPTALGGSLPIGPSLKWNNINVNLKSLFDAQASSAHYYITDIHLSSPTSTAGTVYFDQFMAYRDLSSAINYASTDLKNYFEVLQDLCSKTYHAAYIQPDETRKGDTMIVLPQNTFASLSAIVEDNMIEFGGWSSDPVSDGFQNWYTGTFSSEAGGDGVSQVLNWDSIWKYGDAGAVDSVDVTSQAACDTWVTNYVANHSSPIYGFTVKCRGLPDITPLQYLNINLPEWRISGDYPVASTTYTYDRDGNPKLTADIDLNRPSKQFRNWIRSTRNAVRLLDSRSVNLGLYTIGV